MKPLVAITIGDFNGVGPELALKTSSHPAVKKLCTPVLVGPLNVFEHVSDKLKIKARLEKSNLSLVRSGVIPVIDVGDGIWADVQYGKVTKAAGRSAGISIERAVELCVQGRVTAMVTGPVSKEALHLAGFNFPGQTEMVAMLSRSQRVAMVLVAGRFRVALATIHTALRSVADQISKEKIEEKLSILDEALKRDFLIRNPQIAVLALNPHAGEGGIIGREDQEIILPAVQEMSRRGMHVEGPFSADAFFGMRRHVQYNATLAMYHDQGLIPLKLTGFGQGVNFSAGLKIIRTSPDHGTAYDIAGKSAAKTTSMLEAVKLAVSIARHRGKHD